MEARVRGPGEAAFTEKQLSHAQKLWGAEDSRAGAILRILRQAGLGERDPKKGAGEIPLGRRCAMIGEAIVQHPEMSVLRLCELFGVSRSWYYEKPNFEEKARQEVELRDAIEQVVLEFPGYGYRRVTKALQREGWDVNYKNGSCESCAKSRYFAS